MRDTNSYIDGQICFSHGSVKFWKVIMDAWCDYYGNTEVIHKVIVGVQMLPANIWEYSHSCSHFTVMYINNCVYLIFEMAVSFSEFFWVFNLSSFINWVKKVTSDVLRVFSTILSFQWLSRRPSYGIFILIWNINVLLYFVCEIYGAEVQAKWAMAS